MSALLNSGIYTVPDASRLTGVSMPRIRRWLRGYKAEKKPEKYSIHSFGTVNSNQSMIDLLSDF